MAEPSGSVVPDSPPEKFGEARTNDGCTVVDYLDDDLPMKVIRVSNGDILVVLPCARYGYALCAVDLLRVMSKVERLLCLVPHSFRYTEIDNCIKQPDGSFALEIRGSALANVKRGDTVSKTNASAENYDRAEVVRSVFYACAIALMFASAVKMMKWLMV